jgi:hypothetical protein
MNDTKLVQQLRADMERETRDVRVPPGIGDRALRRNRRRRTIRRAAMAGGAGVTAAAITVAGLTGAFGAASGPSAAPGDQTVAYVLARVKTALNSVNSANFVLYEKIAFAPSAVLERYPTYDGPAGNRPPDAYDPPFSDVLYSPGQSLPASGWLPGTRKVSRVQLWSYRDTERALGFTASGQPDFAVMYTVGRTQRLSPRRADPLITTSTATAVIYGNSTWWTFSGRTAWVPASCHDRFARFAPDWPTAIRDEIACGAYVVAGHQVVDGVRAIKLVYRSGFGPHETLWVSAATYLPVRAEVISHITIDYQWLHPTAANLAHLRFSVPAGFRKVRAP